MMDNTRSVNSPINHGVIASSPLPEALHNNAIQQHNYHLGVQSRHAGSSTFSNFGQESSEPTSLTTSITTTTSTSTTNPATNHVARQSPMSPAESLITSSENVKSAKIFKTEYKANFKPFDQYCYNEVTDSFVKTHSENHQTKQQHNSLISTPNNIKSSASNQDLTQPSINEQNLSSLQITHDASAFEPKQALSSNKSNGNANNSVASEPWYKEVIKRNEKANEYRFKSELGHNSNILTYVATAPDSSSETNTSVGGSETDIKQVVDTSRQPVVYRYKRDNMIAQMAKNNNFKLPKEPSEPVGSTNRVKTPVNGCATQAHLRSITRSTAQSRARSQSSRRPVSTTPNNVQNSKTTKKADSTNTTPTRTPTYITSKANKIQTNLPGTPRPSPATVASSKLASNRRAMNTSATTPTSTSARDATSKRVATAKPSAIPMNGRSTSTNKKVSTTPVTQAAAKSNSLKSVAPIKSRTPISTSRTTAKSQTITRAQNVNENKTASKTDKHQNLTSEKRVKTAVDPKDAEITSYEQVDQILKEIDSFKPAKFEDSVSAIQSNDQSSEVNSEASRDDHVNESKNSAPVGNNFDAPIEGEQDVRKDSFMKSSDKDPEPAIAHHGHLVEDNFIEPAELASEPRMHAPSESSEEDNSSENEAHTLEPSNEPRTLGNNVSDHEDQKLATASPADNLIRPDDGKSEIADASIEHDVERDTILDRVDQSSKSSNESNVTNEQDHINEEKIDLIEDPINANQVGNLLADSNKDSNSSSESEIEPVEDISQKDVISESVATMLESPTTPHTHGTQDANIIDHQYSRPTSALQVDDLLGTDNRNSEIADSHIVHDMQQDVILDRVDQTSESSIDSDSSSEHGQIDTEEIDRIDERILATNTDNLLVDTNKDNDSSSESEVEPVEDISQKDVISESVANTLESSTLSRADDTRDELLMDHQDLKPTSSMQLDDLLKTDSRKSSIADSHVEHDVERDAILDRVDQASESSVECNSASQQKLIDTGNIDRLVEPINATQIDNLSADSNNDIDSSSNSEIIPVDDISQRDVVSEKVSHILESSNTPQTNDSRDENLIDHHSQGLTNSELANNLIGHDDEKSEVKIDALENDAQRDAIINRVDHSSESPVESDFIGDQDRIDSGIIHQTVIDEPIHVVNTENLLVDTDKDIDPSSESEIIPAEDLSPEDVTSGSVAHIVESSTTSQPIDVQEDCLIDHQDWKPTSAMKVDDLLDIDYQKSELADAISADDVRPNIVSDYVDRTFESSINSDGIDMRKDSQIEHAEKILEEVQATHVNGLQSNSITDANHSSNLEAVAITDSSPDDVTLKPERLITLEQDNSHDDEISTSEVHRYAPTESTDDILHLIEQKSEVDSAHSANDIQRATILNFDDQSSGSVIGIDDITSVKKNGQFETSAEKSTILNITGQENIQEENLLKAVDL